MNSRSLLFSTLLWPMILAIGFDSANAKNASPKRDSATVLPAGVETTLKESMSAATVRQIMGAPEQIKPMEAPAGKAEVWIYRRESNVRVERVAVGSVPIATTTIGADGKAHQQTIGEDVKYADRYRYTEEIIQLLMFNGHFVTRKTSTRELQRFN
jgi:hypothetical protein